MSAAAASPNDLVLGRWRPLRPLGTGGSGSVWLARDERTGLPVALKIVPQEGKAAKRAEREARAAAGLRHPRCLRAQSFARDSSHVYIAYEYVPGKTMREAMRAGELDDRAAVETAAQILDGLAHAHAQGIVHRDVKPSNVLLADGDAVDVRLLDFGLAQIKEAETLTAAGDVPGTLAYISPERLAGEDSTAAADVWAVGVLLWETLAGRHPFWSGSLVDTAKKIEAGAPPLHRARPDLPQALVDAVMGALTLNPVRRPSASRLAAELRGSTRKRGRTKGAAPARPVARALPLRLAPAALAAAVAGFGATLLPFYPAHWAAGLALGAAALTLLNERAGLALALAVPFFPLGNVSLGLAIVYAAVAAGLLALSWRDPRSGLFLAVGPVLAPLAGLGLLPLAAQAVRGRGRRAAQVAAAAALAAVVAGLRHSSLPFTGTHGPLGLGLAGSNRPLAVAEELWRAAAARPTLLVEAAVLAAAAALFPLARRRGPWAAAAFGAALMAATLLPAPHAAALPLVVAAWLTCIGLALEPGR